MTQGPVPRRRGPRVAQLALFPPTFLALVAVGSAAVGVAVASGAESGGHLPSPLGYALVVAAASVPTLSAMLLAGSDLPGFLVAAAAIGAAIPLSGASAVLGAEAVLPRLAARGLDASTCLLGGSAVAAVAVAACAVHAATLWALRPAGGPAAPEAAPSTGASPGPAPSPLAT